MRSPVGPFRARHWRCLSEDIDELCGSTQTGMDGRRDAGLARDSSERRGSVAHRRATASAACVMRPRLEKKLESA